ncbi:MAG TPA: sugar transferase [Chloroflexota bacterium]|nr:sugar transferase [Chloroflexota bacterium]
MSRKRSLVVPGLLLALIDVILINLGFAFAWYVRYKLEVGREVAAADYLPLADYYGIQAFLTVCLLLIYRLNGVYGRRRFQGWIDEVSGITAGASVGVALIVVGVFYLRPFGYSRLVFIYALVVISILLAIARLADRLWREHLRRRGIGLRRVLIVGEGPLGRMLMQNIVAQPEIGYKIVGFVDDEPRQALGRIEYLGTCADVARLVWQHEVDEVFIALPSASHLKIAEILIACARQNVRFRIVPDFYELSLNQVDITEINGIPLIGLRETILPGGGEVLKRVIDVAIAAVTLILAAPLMLIIALAIKLDSPGPVIVRQIRIGRFGKPFPFYKFRSMRVGADKELTTLQAHNEADGPLFKMRNDPRVTRVGKWLRRFSLDELPQLFDVLVGHMSLVGPRPGFSWEVEKYEDWHRRRLEIAPGITGLWQVSGRSDLPFAEMALLDIWYTENWSLGLDFKILLRTIPAVILGHGAY